MKKRGGGQSWISPHKCAKVLDTYLWTWSQRQVYVQCRCASPARSLQRSAWVGRNRTAFKGHHSAASVFVLGPQRPCAHHPWWIWRYVMRWGRKGWHFDSLNGNTCVLSRQQWQMLPEHWFGMLCVLPVQRPSGDTELWGLYLASSRQYFGAFRNTDTLECFAIMICDILGSKMWFFLNGWHGFVAVVHFVLFKTPDCQIALSCSIRSWLFHNTTRSAGTARSKHLPFYLKSQPVI